MPERVLTLAAEILGAAEYLLKGGYYNDAVSRAKLAKVHLWKQMNRRRNGKRSSGESEWLNSIPG